MKLQILTVRSGITH